MSANRMIEEICRRPESIARLNADPEKIFAEFRLTEEEKDALRAGDTAAMGRVGIHPILQMHYVMARKPELTQMMSIVHYPGLADEV
jgi:2'-aminobiphenyl-2,3-diol 1,2-dioxygenase small subunit